MTWARIDDGFRDHPKFLSLSLAAVGLWACALAYCSRYLTNGFVPAMMLARLAPSEKPKALASLVAELAAAGVWQECEDGGYQVHDYLDWNLSKERVLAAREVDRVRKESSRTGGRNPVGRPNGIQSESGKNPIGHSRVPARDRGSAHSPLRSDPQIPQTPASGGFSASPPDPGSGPLRTYAAEPAPRPWEREKQ